MALQPLTRAVVLVTCVAALLAACTRAPRGSERRIASLEGKWSSSVNGDVMVVAKDGTFRWGRPYSGRFSSTSTGQVVMSIRENGKWMGGMPVAMSPGSDTLRLTPPGGLPMEFHRLPPVERDSTDSDR
jgi:hypothetical protein